MRLIGFPKKNILVSSLVHTNTNNHLTFHQDICFYLDGFLQIKGYIVYIYIEQQDDVPGICRTFLGENLPCNISVKSDSSGQALSKHQKVPNGLMIYIRYRLLLPWLLGRQNATQIGQKNVCTMYITYYCTFADNSKYLGHDILIYFSQIISSVKLQCNSRISE